MDAENLVDVFTTTSEGIAEVVRLRLEDDGIAAQVTGGAQGGFAGVLGVKVVVKASDAERARQIIAEHQANAPLDDDDESFADEDESE